MAIDIKNINNVVTKPQIYLYGYGQHSKSSTKSLFSGRIDHTKSPIATSSNIIEGTTILDKENMFIFDEEVRIIINGQMNPKPTYARQTIGLGSLVFEGNMSYNTSAPTTINNFAETFFTLNGKEPIRTKAYFYNYLDIDDADYNNISADGNDDINNMGSLGFILKSNPTGSQVFTIKAKTYYRGLESRVAVAVFQIAGRIGSNEFSDSGLSN